MSVQQWCRAQRPALAPGARLQAHRACSISASPAAVSQPQRQAGGRRPAGGARSAAAGTHLRTAAAAAGQPGASLDVEPTLVLAGFYIEEIAGMRQLLDEVGAAEVKVVPTTPARLHRPLGEVLAIPEPQWDQPVPDDWQAGGGWGQQPMVLMAGLDQQGANILLDLLEEAVSSTICPAFAAPENLSAPLGEVLAAALKLWRQSGGSSAGTAGGTAAEAGSTAADAAEGLQFTEELPPLEELLGQPAGQENQSGSEAEAASNSSGGSERSSTDSNQAGGRPTAARTPSSSGSPSSAITRARQLGLSPAPEVVQAEFVERPAVAPSAPAADEEEGGAAPLDLIDAIATGSEPKGPPTTTADIPAAPAAPAEEGSEAAGMSSEELLAATRAALGLNSADLQRLVEDAAAKAAAATGMPIVPGGAAGGVRSGFPSSSPEPAAAAAAAPAAPPVRPAPKSSGGGSAKPWEVPAAAAAASPGGSPGGSAAIGTASKGFGRPAPPSRKAAKRQGRSKSSSSSNGAASQPAAAAQVAPGKGSGAAPRETQQEEQEEQQQAEEPRELPPFDQFVLSRAQLKKVTEQHGLNYEELLAGLQKRGIELSD